MNVAWLHLLWLDLAWLGQVWLDLAWLASAGALFVGAFGLVRLFAGLGGEG